MKYLKPQQRKESHAVTFFIGNSQNGLYTSCLKKSFMSIFLLQANISKDIWEHSSTNNKRWISKYLLFCQTGLFMGCFIALFVGYCIMAHIAGMYTQHSDTIYMETVYPVLRQVVLSNLILIIGHFIIQFNMH